MADGSTAAWLMKGGVLQTGKGILRTRQQFTDVQLHVEFATPSEVKGNSQGRGIGSTDEPVEFALGPLERLVEHRLDRGAQARISDAKALRIAAELVRSSEVHPGIQRGGRPFPY